MATPAQPTVAVAERIALEAGVQRIEQVSRRGPPEMLVFAAGVVNGMMRHDGPCMAMRSSKRNNDVPHAFAASRHLPRYKLARTLPDLSHASLIDKW
jgi:hypothetical protein